MPHFFTFSESTYARGLVNAPKKMRAAFAAACASRLVPSYEESLPQLRSSNRNLLEETLAQVWAFAIGRTQPNLASAARQLIQLIPSEEEYVSLAAAIADDTLAAAAYAAMSVNSSDEKNAVWAARRAYEATIRLAEEREVSDTYTPEMSERLSSNEFVQKELWRQNRDLRDVTATNVQSSDLVIKMKARSEIERALPKVTM
jgi:uncharacterized protein YjaG (DUF416 family)